MTEENNQQINQNNKKNPRWKEQQELKSLIEQIKEGPMPSSIIKLQNLINKGSKDDNSRYNLQLKSILEQKILDPNTRGYNGDTLLTYAARVGNHEAIKTLLSVGANPNIQAKYGDTPLLDALHLSKAITKDSLQSVELLISKGADPNLRN